MNRIRVLNSVLSLLALCTFASAQDKPLADWTETQIGKLPASEKANKVAQELHFRGLVLTENPEDKLISLNK